MEKSKTTKQRIAKASTTAKASSEMRYEQVIKGRWELNDKDAMAVWRETKKLASVCERIGNVKDGEAKRNRKGFQYGDKFIHY